MNAKAQQFEATTKQLTLSAGNHVWTAEFENCEELINPLLSIVRGWKIGIPTEVSLVKPNDRVWRNEAGFNWEFKDSSNASPSQIRQSREVITAICDLHYLLVSSTTLERTEQLNLHCASVQMGDGIVLFPAVSRSGKSTLAVALASRGYRLFGDDVSCISHRDATAFSLGIQPRIRLPIPVQVVGKQFCDFVEANKGLGGDDEQYLNLGPTHLASFGESLPVKAIVHLKRTNKPGVSELTPSNTANGLKSILVQNISTCSTASQRFDTLHRVAVNADCYELKYSKLDDAIEVLSRELS